MIIAVWIVVGILVYLVIGFFVSTAITLYNDESYPGEKDDLVTAALIWPIALICTLLYHALSQTTNSITAWYKWVVRTREKRQAKKAKSLKRGE